MTPDSLAALHARAMVHGRPWSASAFSDALTSPGVFLLTEPPSSLPTSAGGDRDGGGRSPPENPVRGLLVGRVACDEAELLTLAVDTAAQRQGVGRTLLRRFEAEARQIGAQAAFLEVAEDNAAALSLYTGDGWGQAGRRPDYYQRAGGTPANALILRKSFDAC